jgi:Ca-activated chloride channel family protein
MLCGPPARACDLALLLAVDISGSVDPGEYRVQMGGLADALRDGVVSEALVRGRARVALLQWTGSTRQQMTIPWVTLDSFAAADALAARIDAAPRAWRNYSTAVGEALEVSLAAFAQAPGCRRRVIDISGDGPSNEGIAPRAVHPALRAAGVVVNALVIEGHDDDLTGWFWENVITGDAAFVITASGFDDYPRAIRQKLIRETSKQVSGADLQGGRPRR